MDGLLVARGMLYRAATASQQGGREVLEGGVANKREVNCQWRSRVASGMGEAGQSTTAPSHEEEAHWYRCESSPPHPCPARTWALASSSLTAPRVAKVLVFGDKAGSGSSRMRFVLGGIVTGSRV